MKACVSPDDAVDGGGAQDAVGNRHDTIHRLGLNRKPVAGGAETIPVKNVYFALSGSTNDFTASLCGKQTGFS